MCLIDIDDDGGGTADCKGQDGADNSVYTAVIPAVFCVLAVAMVITFALLKREQDKRAAGLPVLPILLRSGWSARPDSARVCYRQTIASLIIDVCIWWRATCCSASAHTKRKC